MRRAQLGGPVRAHRRRLRGSFTEVVVHTGSESIEESAKKIFAYLKGKGLV